MQRLLRILKVRCILLLHDYRAGLPDQNKRHTLSFDDVRQPNSAIWRKIRNEYIFLLKCDMARTRIQNSNFRTSAPRFRVNPVSYKDNSHIFISSLPATSSTGFASGVISICRAKILPHTKTNKKANVGFLHE